MKTFIRFVFLFVFVILFLSCEEVTRITGVKTVSATATGPRSIHVTGKITDLNGKDHSGYGFCYDTLNNPSVNRMVCLIDSDEPVIGQDLEAVVVNLEPLTNYYIRVFLKDGDGYAYGEVLQARTSAPTVPVVLTLFPVNIDSTSVTLGGNITSDGGLPVTERGVCWDTIHNPTISNSKTTDGTGTGSFVSNITGLAANKTYYVRAYATNSVGTAYGNEVNFTTATTPLPTDSLIAYYPFNGNANDESGRENHGTNNGATWSSDRFGNNNSAASFDGINDYILVTQSSHLNSLPLSDHSFSI